MFVVQVRDARISGFGGNATRRDGAHLAMSQSDVSQLFRRALMSAAPLYATSTVRPLRIYLGTTSVTSIYLKANIFIFCPVLNLQ